MLVDVKSDAPTPAVGFLKSSRNSTAQKFSPATQPPCQREVLLHQAKSWWTQQPERFMNHAGLPLAKHVKNNSFFLKVGKRSYNGVNIVRLSRRLHKLKISW